LPRHDHSISSREPAGDQIVPAGRGEPLPRLDDLRIGPENPIIDPDR